MKKNLLLAFTLIYSFGFAQQVLKKITDTDDYTIVSLYSLRNGVDGSNVTGNQNFFGNNNSTLVYFYDAESNIYFENFAKKEFDPPKPYAESICNGTFSMTIGFSYASGEYEEWDNGYTTNDGIQTRYKYQFINTKRFVGEGDSNNDGLFDCFKTTVYMPKKLTNGDLIPSSNIWCGVLGVEGKYVCSYGGVCKIGSNILWFKFNGTTWEYTGIFPNGNPLQYFPKDVCNSLSISESNKDKSEISIYPNPTNNNFTVKNLNNVIESFEYKIIDLAGRIIKTGTSTFNENISVESLTSGSYFIQIETDSAVTFTEKIIKN